LIFGLADQNCGSSRRSKNSEKGVKCCETTEYQQIEIMKNTTVIDKSQMETLESEIKKFAETLPYWAKFLANKILSGGNVSDNDIDTSYSYLLEELKLKAETNKPDITINCILKSARKNL
jgi:hypothetical protein